jgi:hypothetical protein
MLKRNRSSNNKMKKKKATTTTKMKMKIETCFPLILISGKEQMEKHPLKSRGFNPALEYNLHD